MATTQSRIERNKAIVAEATERVGNGKEYDAIEELFAEGYVDHSAPGEALHGRAAFREWMKSVHAGFPDFEATSIRTVGEGDYVATHFTYSGTHDGEFMGIPATGTHVEVSGMAIDRIEDGKIVERWGDADMLGVLQQVGAIDLDGE